ncbi:MAG: ATP-binding protein [Spirochaetaceae bacterium]|nr:ATP-binding protein [Spirochaetaceae bacterium]
MPQLGKQALSQFIRTNCLRQLALNLYPDNRTFRPERQKLGMPYPQSPRPGLRQIQRAGEEWQEEKLDDLTQTFGAGAIVGSPYSTPSNQTRYRSTPLGHALAGAKDICFLVEAEYSVGSVFQAALGIQGHASQFNLVFAELRPDVIAVLAPATFLRYVVPDGTLHTLPANDTRCQLSVIDIKMTAEASPGYFAEVAYYSMALAGWLADQGLDRSYVVVPDGAVWPGSHDASNLLRECRRLAAQAITPTVKQLWDAMQEDLEFVPFEVFALRIRRFLQVDVPQALAQPWRSLEWHVDNRCSFCEYLGEPRPARPSDPQVAPHPDHCLPMAKVHDHVSRVAFVSQGARLSLAQAGISQVTALAGLQHTSPAFDRHQSLRATRTVVAGRAMSLRTGQVAIPPLSGTSASMPRWADLHLYLSVDFDIGSAITAAFGLRAFWREPRAFRSPLTTQRQIRAWPRSTPGGTPLNTWIVDDRDLAAEQRELMAFLQEIHNILAWCQRQDQQTLTASSLAGMSVVGKADYRTKVQFYMWDSLQYDHFARVVGRHLHTILSNPTINYLAWLFPPEELLPNPDLVTQRAPITIVRDVVRGLLAAPVAHYYSLVELARVYHEQGLPANVAAFNMHPLFSTPLSDQIPSERAHEIWAKVTAPRHWHQQMTTYAETVGKRLIGLETVTKRLEDDLRQQLSHTAPFIQLGPPIRQTGVSVDGQLWYAFARLDSALEELDVHQTRAMPPHERSARFRSARLAVRLTGAAERAAFSQLSIASRPGRRVYRLNSDSREVKANIGDFTFALAPENAGGFLDRSVDSVVRGTPLQKQLQRQLGGGYWKTLMQNLLGVTIVALDRNSGLVALDANSTPANILDALEASGVVNLSQDVILDPVYRDFFTRKLRVTLQAIGNPPVARSNPNPIVRQATGQTTRGARATKHTPCADYLWNVNAMAQDAVARNLSVVRPTVENRLRSQGRALNPTQWQAWQDSLSHRAWLVWGPPGTGKSTTVRAIILGACLDAQQSGRPLRVLLSASTYNAIDNVLQDVAQDLAAVLPSACDVFRLRSKSQPTAGTIAPTIDLVLDPRAPSQRIRSIRNRLQNPVDILALGATPQQVHNLLTCNSDSAQNEWFDLIVIDEASQMDVAHSILPISAVASDGAVVLAGDPLQLPPIHQAEPPKDLEDLVGSVYAFWRRFHQMPQSALGVNYRSNDTIVNFARDTGYRATLSSHSPRMRLDLLSPVPTVQPANWPASLFWTPEWARLLDPDQPAICFVYDDGRSSQRNDFEADAVAALLFLLQGRVASRLRNENDAVTGAALPRTTAPYATVDFWRRAVGVVTPHRAQQGLIVTRLQQAFNATGQMPNWIREAVDTVDRFQGQQRDVVIASYTLGDPDQVAEEEEFLMSLNRFNVIASRARAKLVVLVSQEVISHLAHDTGVLRESRLLKQYTEMFCGNSQPMNLGHVDGTTTRLVPGTFRWH